MDISGLFDLTGKRALVTGASVGIGRMIADGLAAAGATVYLVARGREDLDRAVDEIRAAGGRAVGIAADLSDPAGPELVASTYGTYEARLDILVNNAGTMAESSLEEFSIQDWERVTQLCLTVPFFLTQALLPQLRAAASDEDPARVINIGSADGIKAPFLSTFPYPAAKAGLHHLTRQLGKVLGPEGIAVNAIAPGAFPSRRSAPVLAVHLDDFIAATPLRRIGRPDDIAGTVIYMASRAGAFLDGAVLSLDGGLVL
ncbi:SDR family NAD(P)-dependent oxidoreductase [Raineyella sp.]|nr:SDR family NAD(P)-dependent oxidoreductase [Raineyella sp.]MEA5153479.1 SDR family NAD(P)-dependent oxidoreductase [Raineyella sp.]